MIGHRRIDIPCVLENDVGETARPPVTLYITVNIVPPTLDSSSTSAPTEDDSSRAEEATLPGRIQSPTSEHLSPLSHHQPVKTEITIPQSREELSPPSTKNPRFALDESDEAMKQIDGSNTCEKAVKRIKWVMDTLGPIAEVRVYPFDLLG